MGRLTLAFFIGLFRTAVKAIVGRFGLGRALELVGFQYRADHRPEFCFKFGTPRAVLELLSAKAAANNSGPFGWKWGYN